MFALLHTTLKIVFILLLSICVIQIWLSNKSYIFSHEAVANITRKHAGKDSSHSPQKAFDSVIKDLHQQYPGHILSDEDRQWIFMNCGGWMGSMNLLHASLTEYVLIFGTAINTSGNSGLQNQVFFGKGLIMNCGGWMGSMNLLHASLTEYVLIFGTAINTFGNSGRYWANITDTILTGTFRQWREGEIESKMFYPGDTVYHDIGEAAAVQWTPGTWMVEYGRGFVPSTLGFALADTIFSTQDFITLFYVLRIYIKALFLEASTTFAELTNFHEAPKYV